MGEHVIAGTAPGYHARRAPLQHMSRPDLRPKLRIQPGTLLGKDILPGLAEQCRIPTGASNPGIGPALLNKSAQPVHLLPGVGRRWPTFRPLLPQASGLEERRRVLGTQTVVEVQECTDRPVLVVPAVRQSEVTVQVCGENLSVVTGTEAGEREAVPLTGVDVPAFEQQFPYTAYGTGYDGPRRPTRKP